MTSIRYKLTTQDKTTHNGFQLPEDGVWYYPEDTKSVPQECSNTVLHHYAHPLLAVLFNPIHANYATPRLFQIEIDAELGTDGLKGWCRAQRIVKEIELPSLTLGQKVAFAIYCAEPFGHKRWQKWATNWMKGTDRSAAAAHAAADYAAYEYNTAYEYSTAYAAARAAYDYAVYEYSTANDIVRAARARAVARAVARAAARAAAQRLPDFLSIIQKVITN